jgi:hypothetical protein
MYGSAVDKRDGGRNGEQVLEKTKAEMRKPGEIRSEVSRKK